MKKIHRTDPKTTAMITAIARVSLAGNRVFIVWWLDVYGHSGD